MDATRYTGQDGHLHRQIVTGDGRLTHQLFYDQDWEATAVVHPDDLAKDRAAQDAALAAWRAEQEAEVEQLREALEEAIKREADDMPQACFECFEHPSDKCPETAYAGSRTCGWLPTACAALAQTPAQAGERVRRLEKLAMAIVCQTTDGASELITPAMATLAHEIFDGRHTALAELEKEA